MSNREKPFDIAELLFIGLLVVILFTSMFTDKGIVSCSVSIGSAPTEAPNIPEAEGEKE